MLAKKFAGVALKIELEEFIMCKRGSMQNEEIHTSFETHEESKTYMYQYPVPVKGNTRRFGGSVVWLVVGMGCFSRIKTT